MIDQEQVVAKPISPLLAAIVGLCLGIALSLNWYLAGLRTVTVLVDGVSFEHQTRMRTAAEVLAELGIPDERFSLLAPDLQSELAQHTVIELASKEEPTLVPASTIPLPDFSAEYITEQITIPYSVTKKPDSTLDKGTEQIVTPGQEGLLERIRKIVKRDGEVVADVLIMEKVLAEPVDQVVLVGQKEPVKTVATENGTYRYREVKEMLATAYYPGPECTAPYTNGLTAIGLKAGYGIVAVDPRVIPLRSRVYIPGYGIAIAGDVGGAIKGDRVDLCYETLEEAIAFGRQWVKVYILE